MAVVDSADLGYNVMSLSGGEPMIYPDLPILLEQAKSCGMITTITTNGMLLDKRRVDMIADKTDVLAISLDGPRDQHNLMRSNSRAFDTMMHRLENVKSAGIKFGFIFTLTQYNVDQIKWAAEFASQTGASLLQIHPLEIAGHAAGHISDARPDERELAFAFLEVAKLQRISNSQLKIQLDVADRRSILAQSVCDSNNETTSSDCQRSFADLISPLVVEPDGMIVPLQYGFERSLALGNLAESSLRDLAERWIAGNGLTKLREVHRRTVAELGGGALLPFFNWYEIIAQTAAEGFKTWRGGSGSHDGSQQQLS